MTTAEQRQAELEVRLTNGYTRIGEAMQRGHDTGNWERVWIELLREYEKLNDEIAAHHAETRQAELPAMPRAERAA